MQEKARDGRQAEITDRIRTALACGLKVLDEAFETLTVNPDGTNKS